MDTTRQKSSYASAGVNIDAGNHAVRLMRNAVKRSYTPHVLSELGAFGGLFSAAAFSDLNDPVLVATTDGVGTKVILAAQGGGYEGIGHDIVNHCINDILVQGARPLFFLDYVASSKLDPEQMAAIVTGMANACIEAGCALLGGETAEMPGVYTEGHFDVVGTLVGVVDRAAILPTKDITPGDLVVGLASSGPHTNGYSLLRKIFDGYPLDHHFDELDVPLGAALLAPHRSYAFLLETMRTVPGGIKALAHITGGGFIDNIPRILPDGLGVSIQRDSWKVPPLFRIVEQLGSVPQEEMYRVFNMGIGMVLILSPDHWIAVRDAIPEVSFVIGEVTRSNGVKLV